MLYGPPGCGKTSFAKAVATDYELNIHALSLANENINDESLSKLLKSIQTRCIILLDDIDCTALDSEEVEPDETNKKRQASKGTNENARVDDNHDTRGLTKSASIKSASETTDGRRQPSQSEDQKQTNTTDEALQAKKPRLTRGGLLNAVDGVCGPTSRILIMTTNFPERLDPVLLRPGRVDLKVEFGYANREQMRAIFLKTMKPFIPEELKTYDDEKTKALANEFAEKIEEGTLSSAQIQQYCTEHIDDPEGAVAGILEWIKEEKEQTTKIAQYAEMSKKWTLNHDHHEVDHMVEDTQPYEGW